MSNTLQSSKPWIPHSYPKRDLNSSISTTVTVGGHCRTRPLCRVSPLRYTGQLCPAHAWASAADLSGVVPGVIIPPFAVSLTSECHPFYRQILHSHLWLESWVRSGWATLERALLRESISYSVISESLRIQSGQTSIVKVMSQGIYMYSPYPSNYYLPVWWCWGPWCRC